MTDNHMPIVSMLIFYATFISIVLVGLYIYLFFYNKRTLSATEKFIKQATELKSTVFQNINLHYSEASGLKTYFFPNNRCDLYLFDNCLAIVRRQDFIFKIFFAPILLTSDIAATKNMFDYLSIYKPDRIVFKQVIKGEVDIKLSDRIYTYYKLDITLKGLTSEQINQLEKIKNWC